MSIKEEIDTDEEEVVLSAPHLELATTLKILRTSSHFYVRYTHAFRKAFKINFNNKRSFQTLIKSVKRK